MTWLLAHPGNALLVVVVAALLAGGFYLVARSGGPHYRATPLMTGNELEFFGRLQRALPECYVFPQVAMSALITPTTSGKRWRSDFWRISQKRVDWVLFSRHGLKLIAIVELDDRTHDRGADRDRDAMTASAGIRTLRFESRAKPPVAEIRKICLAAQ